MEVNKMNLNHLKAFVKVVQTKSYQEAAKKLSVSQPAITLRIKSLEEHFKVKLFQRKSDGIQLTSQGEMLYKEFLVILDRWEQLELNFLSDKPAGRLTIGASTIPSEYLLPEFLKNFRTQYKEISFNMKVSSTEEVIRWLLERSVDVIVTGRPDKYDHLESVPVFHDQLKIIVPPDHVNTPDNFSELLECDWILRDPHSDTRQSWERALLEHGYNLELFKLAGQMGSTEAVIAAVEAGLGISVVSSLAAHRAKSLNRIKIVDVDDFVMTRSFYLSSLKENKHLPIIAAFLNSIKGYNFSQK
jgi:DNA-binding transcriptional LysR family regulator